MLMCTYAQFSTYRIVGYFKPLRIFLPEFFVRHSELWFPIGGGLKLSKVDGHLSRTASRVHLEDGTSALGR